MLVLDDERDEAAELIEFALDVGVEQRFIAFPSAPEHIILTAEPMRYLERGADLAGGIGEDVRIRIGRRARHVAAMREQIGRAPEQPHLARCHLLLEEIGDGVEVGNGLGKRGAFRRGVDIVEGEEGHIEQAKQLESDIGLGARHRHRIRAMMPGPQERLATKGIAAGPAERVPVTDGETQVILEPLPTNDTILVVPAEGERVLGVLAAIGDRRGRSEESW